MRITDYRLRTLAVPCEPSIGDSQSAFDTAGVAHLELETDAGETGVGLGGADHALPLSAVKRQFAPVGDDLVGESPFALVNRQRRPRGGNRGRGAFYRAVDTALWDLCGKHLGMALYRLLGGSDPRVPAYASGLAFDHDDATTRAVYERFADQGFDAAKVKVGYPTVEADVERLELVEETLDAGTLMVDANEAWSPKEAIRRVRAYRDAGFDLAWVEDPVLRDDVEGIRRVAEALPERVNVGEYVDLEGKRRLLDARAADVLNLRSGVVSRAREAAALAHAYGVPTHVGDVHGEIGVHLAAALPETTRVEYWRRPWDRITEGARAEDGHLIAPEGPGHGVSVGADAIEEYGVE